MPFFRILIWTSLRAEPFKGVRQYSTDKIEAVQQTLEKRCRKYYGSDFRKIEVVMLSELCQEVRDYQNKEAIFSARIALPSQC